MNDLGLHRSVHLLALPFLLHLRPFHQGLTSAEELGQTVATSILADLEDGRDLSFVAAGEAFGLLLTARSA